jgi:hypothetical protein
MMPRFPQGNIKQNKKYLADLQENLSKSLIKDKITQTLS